MSSLNVGVMKRTLCLLVFAAAMTVACPPSFAARQALVANGSLSADGALNGVDLTGNATLTVGTVGGAQADIFTANNPVGTVAGLAVSASASSQGNITFNTNSTVYGDIGVTQPGGPFLLHIDAGADGATVNFPGSVFATTLGVTGTGTVNFNSGDANVVATNFAGDGTIGLSANTTVTGALTTTLGANTGTLSLAGGSTLDGAVGGATGLKAINVIGGSNSAGVTGTITGAVDAFSFSLGTNTLNIGGALTIANQGVSGVINTTLASSSVFGNISPIGATNLGSTLAINVTVPSTTFLALDTQFDIVKTRTGTLQSGTDGSALVVTVQDPTNPLYAFAAVPLSGTSAGLVSIKTTGIPIQVAPSPVVPVLLAIPLPPPDLTNVLAAINALSQTDSVVNAVAQLDPTNNGATTQAVVSTVNAAMGAITTHLGEAGNNSAPGRSGVSTGDFWKDNGFWVKGFGENAKQDTRKGANGYDSSMWGVIVGADGVIASDVLLGVAGGYAATSVNNKGESGGTDIDSYIGTIYVSRDPPGPWYGDMGFTFTWNSYDSTRRIVLPGIDRTAESSPDGQVYTGFWDLGYVIPLDAQWNVTPVAGLSYSHSTIGKYTETGAGDLNLIVKRQHYDQLLANLGVKVDRRFDNAFGKWVPEAHIRWLYDFIGDPVSTTSTFTGGGSTFDTRGLDPEQSTYNLGTGFTFYSKGNVSITGVYDYKFGTDYSSHTGLGTVRWTF